MRSAIARARQRNVEGYPERRRERARQGDGDHRSDSEPDAGSRQRAYTRATDEHACRRGPRRERHATRLRQATDARLGPGEPRARGQDRLEARRAARRGRRSRRSPTARSTAATTSRCAAPTCSSSSRSAPTPSTGLGTNDAVMELLAMIDAAVGGSAHRVIAVTPVVRLLAAGQEVGSARADQRAAGGADARGRRASTGS